MGFNIGSIAKKLSTVGIRRVKKIRKGAGRYAKKGIIYGAKKTSRVIDPKGKVGKLVRDYKSQFNKRPMYRGRRVTRRRPPRRR